MLKRHSLLTIVAVVVLSLSSVLPAYAALRTAEDEREWLVMLYQNADDEVLEGDIFTDLNEAELVGSTDAVTIVSQIDRYDGAFDGDGNWTTARRFLVTQDDDLATLGSEELDDLGEVDSGAPETLVDFAVWAIEHYPAQKYALILSDHGAGWVGGWNDNAPEEGSSFTINDIDQALAVILAETGVEQFEFVGFDACLMSSVEALAGVAPYARYSVASQEVEPAIGWAYSQFLGSLADNPGQSGRELAETIVETYIVGDVRIQNDEARSDYVMQNYGIEEEVSAEELAQEEIKNVTLTAIDLGKVANLMDALNEFAYALNDADPAAVARARTYAQSFESVFGEDAPSPYLDLGNFAALAAEFAGSDDLNAALEILGKAYQAAILAEMHGEGRPGATGFSIFFPTPELLVGVGTEDSEMSYTAYASRFAGASLWDDFLAAYYTGTAVDPDTADPALMNPDTAAEADLEDYAAPLLAKPEDVSANEVASDLSMTPLKVSDDEITAGETTELSTQITGEEIGYIYFEVTRYDEETDSYILEEMDFIAADDTVEFEDIYYPAWTEDDLAEFIFVWEPTIYSLSDGETEAFALFEPAVYGMGAEDGEYDVRGIYTFADSGEERAATMVFDGNLEYKSLLTFTNADGSGAPRAMAPQAGDTFTIIEQRYELDEDGEWVVNENLGETLTFGDQPFAVTAYESYPGEYSLGITVTDLYDNAVTEYATVYVTEE